MRTPSVIRSEPLYDQIYEIIWQKILAGEIPAGTRLRDVEWAEKLSVSRTPVREGLRKLQQDGVLEPIGHGRYVLKRIDADELRSLYRCRAVLEGLAIRDLSNRLSAQQLKQLKGLISETAQSIGTHEFTRALKLNTDFHESLIRVTSNPYLMNLLENIKRLILYARSTLKGAIDEHAELSVAYADHLNRSQAHHMVIVDRLAMRDFVGAAARMEQHLFETAEDMRHILVQVERPKQAPAADTRPEPAGSAISPPRRHGAVTRSICC